jgi:hypothetical protein
VSNLPAVVDAEFTVLGATEEQLHEAINRWLSRSHGIDRELLLYDVARDRYAFTNACKRAMAAAVLDLMGEIELARKVAGPG